MLWIFSAALLIGVSLGCLYRVPALVLLSTMGLVATLAGLLSTGHSFGDAFMTASLMVASLQFGYLVGAGFRWTWRSLKRQTVGAFENALRFRPYRSARNSRNSVPSRG